MASKYFQTKLDTNPNNKNYRDEVYGARDLPPLSAPVGNIRMNKDEREARRLVWNRYLAMRDDPERKKAESQWSDGYADFEGYVPPLEEGDWRSNLKLPDAFAGIQAQMQETIERKSRPTLHGVEISDQSIAEFNNALMNYNMDKTGFDYQWFLAKYHASICGTSFVSDYFRVDKRWIHDPTDVDEEGKLVYTKKLITDFDDDYTEWIPNDMVFVDPAAKHINEAKDCVLREVMDIDEFRRVYKEKPDFQNVGKVRAGGEVDNKVQYFDHPRDLTANDVEILHYFNRAVDCYYVLANNVLVRYGYIPYKHKELPIAVRYQYQIPGRFWGIGVPRIIKYLTEERKAVRDLRLDRSKMSLNKMFLGNDMINIDEEELTARPHGLVEVNTNGLSLRDVIMPIEYSDEPQSASVLEQNLLEDMRRAHGIDDRIQGVQTGGTAFEAAMLKESSQKRLNMIEQLSEMDTLIRIGRLKWSNIQFFYPTPKVEKIIEENEEREEEIVRKFTIKGKQFEVAKGQDGKNKLEMQEIDGYSNIQLDKKMARYMEGEWDVIVNSEAYVQMSKPVQQAKITEMITRILAAPTLAAELEPSKAVARYLSVHGEKVKDWVRGDGVTVAQWRAIAEAENRAMREGIPLAPTEGATEEHTLVHLMQVQTEEYNSWPEVAKDALMDHIMGEHQNNPKTGSIEEAVKEMEGSYSGTGQQPTPGGLGGEATQLPAPGEGGEGVEINPADIQASRTVEGEAQTRELAR